jgi:hypothetical protein
VGEDDAKNADIEHLFGDPLIFLTPVWRHTHHGCNCGTEGRPLDDLAAVEHEL